MYDILRTETVEVRIDRNPVEQQMLRVQSEDPIELTGPVAVAAVGVEDLENGRPKRRCGDRDGLEQACPSVHDLEDQKGHETKPRLDHHPSCVQFQYIVDGIPARGSCQT